jgi:hypothetical protein
MLLISELRSISEYTEFTIAWSSRSRAHSVVDCADGSLTASIARFLVPSENPSTEIAGYCFFAVILAAFMAQIYVRMSCFIQKSQKIFKKNVKML